MRDPKLKMKSFLTICFLLFSTAAIASAQKNTLGRSETRLPHASLTRAQKKEAERRLAAMGYWTGAVDGEFAGDAGGVDRLSEMGEPHCERQAYAR